MAGQLPEDIKHLVVADRHGMCFRVASMLPSIMRHVADVVEQFANFAVNGTGLVNDQ